VRTAAGEWQDFNWTARGLEAMSRLVFFLYSSKEAAKIVSKFVEEEPLVVEVDGTLDIVRVEGAWLDA
jgi:hypothetical protein